MAKEPIEAVINIMMHVGKSRSTARHVRRFVTTHAVTVAIRIYGLLDQQGACTESSVIIDCLEVLLSTFKTVYSDDFDSACMEAREWGGDHADQASLGQAYSILGRSVLARRLAGHFLLLLSTVAIPVINTMTIRYASASLPSW